MLATHIEFNQPVVPDNTIHTELSWGKSLSQHFINCLEKIENVFYDYIVTPVKQHLNEWIDDRKCKFAEQLNSVSSPFTDDTISTELSSDQPVTSAFLDRADLCTMLEKLAVQIDNQDVAASIRTLQNKLTTGTTPVTLKEWLGASVQLEVIAIKYRRSCNQQTKNFYSDYRQICQDYKLQLARYKKALQSTDTPFDLQAEKTKLNRLHSQVMKYDQTNLNRQQFLTTIIQDLLFISKLASSNLAKTMIRPRLKEINKKKMVPGFFQERSGYVSASAGAGLGTEGINIADIEVTGQITAGASTINMVTEDNQPGLIKSHHVSAGVKAGTKIKNVVNLSAAYTHGRSAGQLTIYEDSEAYTADQFDDLVNEMRHDAQIKPWLSKAKILGVKSDFLLDLLTGDDAMKFDEITGKNRAAFDTVKHRLNIFAHGITEDSFQSIKKQKEKTVQQEIKIRKAETAQDKNEILADIEARNARKNLVQKITIPKLNPFKAGFLKKSHALKFNATAGIEDTPLSLSGSVSLKSEQDQQKVINYLSYCEFLQNPLKPPGTGDEVKNLVAQQCAQFKPALLTAWQQQTAQIRLTPQGHEIIKMSADKQVSDTHFLTYLANYNLSADLLRLRTDPALKQPAARWDFIERHGLVEQTITGLDEETELQFNYLKEDFRLYKNSSLTIKKLEKEISRLQLSLPPQNARIVSKTLKEQIKKEKMFCQESGNVMAPKTWPDFYTIW